MFLIDSRFPGPGIEQIDFASEKTAIIEDKMGKLLGIVSGIDVSQDASSR